MSTDNAKDLSKMPNTLAWLEANIKGFAENYAHVLAAKAHSAETRARAAEAAPAPNPIIKPTPAHWRRNS